MRLLRACCRQTKTRAYQDAAALLQRLQQALAQWPTSAPIDTLLTQVIEELHDRAEAGGPDEGS